MRVYYALADSVCICACKDLKITGLQLAIILITINPLIIFPINPMEI